MGQTNSSKKDSPKPVNYDCPICKETKRLPNLLGKFFIINEKECQCNGCNTIFPKSKFYK
jgi:hypothetical protein